MSVETADDATTRAILDATRAAVLAFGVRRTTLSDVARRAGVSRMTVYRRYPDVEALVRDLMTREFGALILDGPGWGEVDAAGYPHVRAALVARMAGAVRALRAHPLFRKVLEVEPELLVAYVVDRMGATQTVAAEALLHAVRAGQADGSVRDGDPRLIAQATLLVLQSFAFSSGIHEDLADEAVLGELERVLDGALAPVGRLS